MENIWGLYEITYGITYSVAFINKLFFVEHLSLRFKLTSELKYFVFIIWHSKEVAY